jgi:glycerophosphoryl diester phosphodiesterase
VAYGYAQGADAVEIDVWCTRDGTVVLHHDATTDRTTDRAGWQITGVTYEQLRTLSAGRWKGPAWSGEVIPRLDDVTVPAGRGLVVEVEEGPQVVDAVLRAACGLRPEQIMYITKNLDTAAELKVCAPEQPVLWILDTTPRWQIGSWAMGHRRGPDSQRRGFDDPADVRWLVETALARGLDGLDTLFAYPPDLPGALADAGLQWMVWTANDARAVRACVEDGAWGITTDVTAQVRDWLVGRGYSPGW